MSDTPRTDAAKKIVLGGVGGDWEVVHIAFSRQLERELNAANQRIKRLEDAGDELLMWLGEDISESSGQLLQDAWHKAKEDKP